MRLDLRLNAIVDPERAGRFSLADLAARCVRGGATLVQLRNKRSETRALIEQARAIKQALAPFAVPFVVNDRVDVAMAASGGVYATSSKQQKNAPIGPAGLTRIIAALRRRAPALPVCGIAGIDASNAAEVIAAGADGVAVISALALVPSPETAAHQLRDIVDAVLAKRGTS